MVSLGVFDIMLDEPFDVESPVHSPLLVCTTPNSTIGESVTAVTFPGDAQRVRIYTHFVNGYPYQVTFFIAITV